MDRLAHNAPRATAPRTAPLVPNAAPASAGEALAPSGATPPGVKNIRPVGVEVAPGNLFDTPGRPKGALQNHVLRVAGEVA